MLYVRNFFNYIKKYFHLASGVKITPNVCSHKITYQESYKINIFFHFCDDITSPQGVHSIRDEYTTERYVFVFMNIFR